MKSQIGIRCRTSTLELLKKYAEMIPDVDGRK